MAKYPGEFSIQQLINHSDDLISRFENRNLGDTIYRVGCDLQRKLSRNDRIVAPLMDALEYRKMYDLIILVLASGFRFRATDPTGHYYSRDQEFIRMMNKKGINYILENICEIRPEDHRSIYKKANNIFINISKDYSKLLHNIIKNITCTYTESFIDENMENKLVFFVDDDKMILNLLEYIFKSKPDYKIKTFESCEDCISHLHDKPDVIVLDYLFAAKGAMNGLEGLTKITEIDKNNKVIMLSSQENIKLIPEFIKAGARKYISKDAYFIDSLFEAIDELLEIN